MKRLLLIVMLLCSYSEAFARAGGHGHGWGSGPSSDAGSIILIPFVILGYIYIWWEDREEMASEAREKERLHKLIKN